MDSNSVTAAPPATAAKPFTVDHFRAWTSNLILDNDEPWQLDPWQADYVADLFAGYRVALLIVPEGNGKTTLLAGIALYHIRYRRTGYVPVAASSRDQAEWIYRQAEGFVFRSELEDTFRCLEGYRRIRCDEMGSRVQIFAADARSGDGVVPTLCILDELHRHRDLALYQTWIGKWRKRGGQVCAISTAGEAGSEFEEERTRLRHEATEIEHHGCFTRAVRTRGEAKISVLHEWAVPEGGDVEDLDLVKQANPFTGVTVEDLAEKRVMPGTTLHHWSRFTCNLPTRAVSAAIAEREWHEAGGETIPVGEPVWAGLDCGFVWDTTALVPLWMPERERRILGPATILTPPMDGTQLPLATVENALIQLHDRNPIHTLVMDISGARDVAEWAAAELGCTVVARGQAIPAQVLDYDRFMEGLRNGWLRHCDDPGLTRHVLNAVTHVMPRGDALFARVSTSRSPRGQVQRVIDALVAAAMVHSVAIAEVPNTTPLVAMA